MQRQQPAAILCYPVIAGRFAAAPQRDAYEIKESHQKVLKDEATRDASTWDSGLALRRLVVYRLAPHGHPSPHPGAPAIAVVSVVRR